MSSVLVNPLIIAASKPIVARVQPTQMLVKRSLVPIVTIRSFPADASPLSDLADDMSDDDDDSVSGGEQPRKRRRLTNLSPEEKLMRRYSSGLYLTPFDIDLTYSLYNMYSLHSNGGMTLLPLNFKHVQANL